MFRLAHFSDPHLPPPPRGTGEIWPSKRTLSRFAWRRKQRQHDPAVLAALMADIAAYGPDHIALTGDLTNFSAPEEYASAQAWLERQGPPGGLTVSPGNHDALVADGHAERMASFEPWFGDGLEPAFPHLRRRGRVAIVNLCSAVPTPLALATGTLGGPQLARLADALEATGREGLFRVLLIHHPVVTGAVSKRKALTDLAALHGVLRGHGAELILHGHGHEPVFGAAPGPCGAIPVLGAPSASSPPGAHHAAARWHALEIGDDGAVRVIVRSVGPGRSFAELGRYDLPPPPARSGEPEGRGVTSGSAA